ncbi:MAG: CapA family protein [Bacillota bacterium]|nr:CapA family protein [Bacillota bacterium]
MRRIKAFSLFFCLVVFLTACSTLPSKNEPADGNNGNTSPEPVIVDTPEPEPVDILISAVGDIMVHQMQLDAQYNSSTKQYDFTNNFQYIKPYIQRADLSLANLETTFAGDARKYSGYPMFNTPDAMADALKDAGFDVISTSNNHAYDKGTDGLIRTVDVLEDRNLGVIGTKRQPEDESFMIVDVKGIQVGLSAYTYETPRYNGQRTINSIVLSSEAQGLIDSFGFEDLDTDLKEMTDRVRLMREKGAEVVVFFMHWGNEYHRQPSTTQKQIAETLIDAGVDIIFGSHPHVIQPIDLITTSSGRQGVVAYSLGNFLSNQRYEFLKQPYTEDGMVVSVSVTKEPDGEIILSEVSYTPTWVHRYKTGGQIGYNIVPLPDALDDRDTFNLFTDDSVRRAQNALNNTAEIVSTDSLSPIPVHSLFTPQTYQQ